MSPLSATVGRALVLVVDDLPGHEAYYLAALAHADVQFRFVDAAKSAAEWASADVLIVGICDRYKNPPGLAVIADVLRSREQRPSRAPAIHVVLGPVSAEVAEQLDQLGKAGMVRLHRLTSIFCAPDRVRELVD